MDAQELPDFTVEKQKTSKIKKTLRFFAVIILLILIFILFRSCSEVKPTPSPKNSVVVAPVQIKDIPVYLTALGSVTPIYTVNVRTQVNGQLLRVLFKEGQTVKRGELLAEIDPRPFLAQLKQYEGQLARDQALLVNAQVDLKRYQTLWSQDSVAQQTLTTQQALVEQYEAAIKIDQGLIDAVNVNLAYCLITSPIDGRVGLRLVDAGNIVHVSDTTGIAVVNTFQPITVVFTLPEEDIHKVTASLAQNKLLPIAALDRSQNKELAHGFLLAVDNEIDLTTGTLKFKAQFANQDNRLFPNQFVNIRMLIYTLHGATVVLTSAIQYDTKGNFVYLLGNDSTVQTVPVKTGASSQGYTSIESELKPGQSVVVEGADKLINGARVTVTNNAAIPS